MSNHDCRVFPAKELGVSRKGWNQKRKKEFFISHIDRTNQITWWQLTKLQPLLGINTRNKQVDSCSKSNLSWLSAFLCDSTLFSREDSNFLVYSVGGELCYLQESDSSFDWRQYHVDYDPLNYYWGFIPTNIHFIPKLAIFYALIYAKKKLLSLFVVIFQLNLVGYTIFKITQHIMLSSPQNHLL